MTQPNKQTPSYETDLTGGISLDSIWFSIGFVKQILPDHYTVQPSKKEGSIHCKSSIGIRKSPYLNPSTGTMVTDAEDEEHWGYIVGAIKQYFGDNFQEIFHNTCFCHVDFTIYLKFKSNGK